MAVLACGSSTSNKENVPPYHAVGVKSHGMKRPGACGVKARRRWRPPLSDITNLFVASLPHSAAAASAAVPVSLWEGQAAARSGAPDVVAVKGRRSPRKDFR
jgi:hypothetical protein